ncbi:hypothetical protein F4604DRAFT_1679145 [Suillus subluteus]|nr:hypothetical protein F4604DRAFT_1679145 [Suillus subluteus]
MEAELVVTDLLGKQMKGSITTYDAQLYAVVETTASMTNSTVQTSESFIIKVRFQGLRNHCVIWMIDRAARSTLAYASARLEARENVKMCLLATFHHVTLPQARPSRLVSVIFMTVLVQTENRG